VPIRRIDDRMATLDDWEVLLALHSDEPEWDGLVTTDAKMLSLPRELAVLCQTKLTLVVAEAVGQDPIKATGLVLAHISRICEQTRPETPQVWRRRTSTKPAEIRGTSSCDSPRAERSTLTRCLNACAVDVRRAGQLARDDPKPRPRCNEIRSASFTGNREGT
jgi:hypothetical protein